MKKLYERRQNSSGFTLVELILAVAFFSFILLFVAAAFIQVNRQFVKGRIARQVQADGRLVVEDITRGLRAAGESSVIISEFAVSGKRRICFDKTRYAWSTLADLDSGVAERYSSTPSSPVLPLVKTNDYNGSNCEADIVEGGGEELLSENSVVQFLGVAEKFGNISGLYEITAVISTPQFEIIGAGDGRDANCETLNAGGSVAQEYCGLVNFTSIVNVR